MQEHFEQIKKTYDDFQNHLLKNNVLLARDTGIGYWGVTPLAETFEIFKRINLGKYKNMIDIGSGDGRIVLLASLFGVKSKGIEFDKVAVQTSKNAQILFSLT